MGVDNAMAYRHPHSERGHDLYETPECATKALLANVRLPRKIWEPACGRGAISRVLKDAGHEVYSSDLIDYGYGDKAGLNFLDIGKFQHRAGAIVTNPPFKHANAFARLAIERAPMVCMLLRLAFLEGWRDPDRREALDGGSLAEVLVFKHRLPMMHRDGWDGPKANSGTAFAWFVWHRNHTGPISIRRIDWWEAA